MKHFTIPAFICSAMALSACKTQISTTAYMSDIAEIKTNETITELTTPATISFEIGSDEKCNEHKSAINDAMATEFTNVQFNGCHNEQFDSYISFNVDASIIRWKNGSSSQDPTHPIWMMTSTNQRNMTDLKIGVNQQRLERAFNSIPDDVRSYQNFEFNPVIKVDFNNDTREPVVLITEGAFLNGEPVIYGESVMKRREEKTVALSDVSNAYVAQNNNYATRVFTVDFR